MFKCKTCKDRGKLTLLTSIIDCPDCNKLMDDVEIVELDGGAVPPMIAYNLQLDSKQWGILTNNSFIPFTSFSLIVEWHYTAHLQSEMINIDAFSCIDKDKFRLPDFKIDNNIKSFIFDKFVLKDDEVIEKKFLLINRSDMTLGACVCIKS
jgi:hypothetical protein